MTEAEWLVERVGSQHMVCALDELKVWRTRSGKRKLRLFASGSCRLLWDHLNDSQLREAVEVAERYAEGLASAEELALAHERARQLIRSTSEFLNRGVEERTAVSMVAYTTHKKAFDAAFMMTTYRLPLDGKPDSAVARALLCDLLRCVFGNPFRPVTFDPLWRKAFDGTAIRIAQGIYEERAFDRLPFLADALEDAGCDNPGVLSHCRGGGSHVLGCWVLDALLGKAESGRRSRSKSRRPEIG